MSKTREILKLYRNKAESYDRHMRATGHYFAQQKLLSRLDSLIQEPILDLACGTGFLVSKLAKTHPKISANDFSNVMLDLARKNIHSNSVVFMNQNAESLRIHKIKFGSIVCCNLFFYIQHRKQAIALWKSLLKKKGSIFFFEEHPFIKPKQPFGKDVMDVIDPIPPEKIITLMERGGFVLQKHIKTRIDSKHWLHGLVFQS